MDNLAFGAKPAVLRCGRCGTFVDWGDSRPQVVCGCRPHLDLPPVLVREATPPEREKALELFTRDFGHMQLVAYGEAVSLEDALALVAEADGGIAGALAWRHFDDAVHILGARDRSDCASESVSAATSSPKRSSSRGGKSARG